jgi:hypothetical protein
MTSKQKSHNKTTIKIAPDAPQSKRKGFQKKNRGNVPHKVKQPSKSTIKLKAWYSFSKFIRTRDCIRTTGTADKGKCITCGEVFNFKDLQAGHFIPGRHNSNLFSERGVHAQCRSCNIWNHGRPLEYRRAIIELYGDGADELLEEEAKRIKKYSIEDLQDMAVEYKNKYNELLKKA